ncbi:MAG: hypothetical protein HY233_07255 [Acidobacteriales bacterium]|nr:hypothetical protein [Terriglobales bacterium]
MADNALAEGSRRAPGRKCATNGPVRHAVEIKFPSRRRGRVSLPLVRSKQPGAVALDNAKIFEIIPFP